MKVLFLVTSLATGGKERQVVELIRGLINKGVECSLILLKDKIEFEDTISLNVEIHIIDKSISSPYKILKSIYNICRKNGPDIIQAWDIITAIYAGMVAKLLRIPFINYSIQYAIKLRPLSRDQLLSSTSFFLSKRVIANSKAGLIAHGKKTSRKYRYIHNGFDFNRLSIEQSKEELRKKFGLNTKYVVGMVGNFLEAKDYITFTRAALNMLAKRNDVMFVGIGDGYNLEKILAMIPQEKKAFFSFPGSTSQVEHYIKTFDLGCLICNTDGHAEGISNSIMEKMATGIPVIATDSGGTKELIVDGKSGFIIQPFNIEALTERINYLLDHQAVRLEMGHKSRKQIKDKFSIDRFINSFQNIYSEVL